MRTVSLIFRAGGVGALLLMAWSSALAALFGGTALWIGSRLPWRRPWHALLALAFVGLAWILVRRGCRRRRGLAMAVAGLLAACALVDLAGYYALLGQGVIASRLPLPLSALVALLLLGCLWEAHRPGPRPTAPGLRRLAALAGLGGGGLGALLALILCFGATDYRRRADCAIVLGAGVRPDGSLSLALSDRVRTGAALYRAGLVERVIMTGGIDARGHDEAEVMARAAVALGVPPSALRLDSEGRNTRASARNCAALMEREGLTSALLVSHDYHLLRCRFAFRVAGVRAVTVPAVETRPLRRKAWYILRECAAYQAYVMPGAW